MSKESYSFYEGARYETFVPKPTGPLDDELLIGIYDLCTRVHTGHFFSTVVRKTDVRRAAFTIPHADMLLTVRVTDGAVDDCSVHAQTEMILAFMGVAEPRAYYLSIEGNSEYFKWSGGWLLPESDHATLTEQLCRVGSIANAQSSMLDCIGATSFRLAPPGKTHTPIQCIAGILDPEHEVLYGDAGHSSSSEAPGLIPWHIPDLVRFHADFPGECTDSARVTSSYVVIAGGASLQSEYGGEFVAGVHRPHKSTHVLSGRDGSLELTYMPVADGSAVPLSAVRYDNTPSGPVRCATGAHRGNLPSALVKLAMCVQ